MKQTIEGIAYNTDKATKIREWDNNLPVTNFNFYSMTLYKTSENQYFVLHEGGVATVASTGVKGPTDGTVEGFLIEPITEEESHKFIENPDIWVTERRHYGESKYY